MEENRITAEISKIRITGNILPTRWLRQIKRDSKRPDLLACMILSDIIYWYRGTELRDETTGEFIGYRKKFAADKLQKQYGGYGDQFGLNKDQIKRAIDNLVDQNLITREFRTIETDKGTLYNVMFLEPVPSRIMEITHGDIDPEPKKQSKKKPPSNNEKDVAERVIEHLNSKTGKKFSPTAKGNVSKVVARLHEGYTEEDCIKVVDNMVAKWGEDPRMWDYLRPATLFNNGEGKRQFESYLNTTPAGIAKKPVNQADDELSELMGMQ